MSGAQFEQRIQQWVILDNQLKILNDKAKEIREKKNELMIPLINHIEENHLEKTNIQISDGKLRFSETKVTQPITFKYLESCLKDIIKNEQQVNVIMEHIKKKRENKLVRELKRFYNN